MQIEGKDDDDPNTVNAKISYSIISQEPEGTGHMFTLDEKTGKLYVKEPTLDREVSVHTVRHSLHILLPFCSLDSGSFKSFLFHSQLSDRSSEWQYIFS